MNRKLILGSSAFVLAIGGFFAGKANSKFATTSLYYQTQGGHCRAINTAAVFTTNSASNTISFVTAGGGAPSLYVSVSGTTCGTALPAGKKIVLQK